MTRAVIGSFVLALLGGCLSEDGRRSTAGADVDTSGDSETVADSGGDADGDGYTVPGGDCDDEDPSVNPTASDSVGDGVDQNCDGVDGTDNDGDGYVLLPNSVHPQMS